ncbi:hypothetical protein SAMN05192558_101616 [Actinokineospora alba]|uniref:Circularly permuted ATP-grasp type 2 n=1 Tax=Actinokineospora alba TaxID=504798 RepID=A0A1H0G1B2_9PSEU|nr:hypothetical protein [Actinokineospora alba]TDP69717.1 hypothetical protein C8E96_5311 [Actinokineospora alba]SDI10348.1 hypothetical protein SAMN05421871_103255 [Actinokineospora alba]SDO00675.1 hypothetical protein SAMN05192558_101616 [Actinokineospora alba]
MSSDAVTRAYLTAAGEPGSRLGAAIEQVRSAASLAAWGGQFLDRPLFVGEAELRAFGADLHQLTGLLLDLPGRLFDGDLERFADAAGVDGERGALMRRLGVAPPATGRADVYHDGEAYRVLELGIGSDHGGWDRSGEVPRAFLKDEAFAAFAAEHRLGYTHSPTELAATLRGVAGDDDPVVALVEGPGALGEWIAAWQPLRDTLRDCGIRCHLGELGDLSVHGDKLFFGGDRVDVVYRCFDTEQVLADPAALDLVERICKLHEAGEVVLWTPLESNLFVEKGCLALLSDHGRSGAFSADERTLIDRVVPWTRLLSEPSLRADPDLLDRCRAEREQLILKPTDQFGGHGIVAGWETPEREWLDALHAAASTSAVIQRRVIPRTEPAIGPDGQPETWHAVYGFYYTPTGFAGVHARVAPVDRSAVIGLATNQSVRSAGVFHIEEN